MLEELDGARLDGAYAGNRLKRYWLRPAHREVGVDESHEPDSPREPDKPDEPNEPDDGSSKRWPLPGRGFFVQIP